MKRHILPLDCLPAWAEFNHIVFNGVEIRTSSQGRGLAVVATREFKADGVMNGMDPFITVPKDLILSLEAVEGYAKSDKWLREVLEARGEWARTARGAILIFLLLQITKSAQDVTESIGLHNPWTEYVKFLPSFVPLPTFWSETEQGLLEGTSLAAALRAKLKSLKREFEELRLATVDIPWCKRQWWDDQTGMLTFEDWKIVDAMYRSRAMQIPEIGDVMIPCLDMANHASGEETVAGYEVDENVGDGLLEFLGGIELEPGDEITITYGDKKGACEMVFTYGFVEESMETAQEIFLELDVPDDDPLKRAKLAVLTAAPGFKLFIRNECVEWEGPLIWLICVNEEDGLEFRLSQRIDGERELHTFWQGEPLNDTSSIQKLLERDALWEVFLLRANTILQQCVESSILRLNASETLIHKAASFTDVDASVLHDIARLRELEAKLLQTAWEDFEKQKAALIETETVRRYLESATLDIYRGIDEDFT
ncbi:MAG: hypothetical protein M1835_006337 [Candelina submexicana]|nr:MAG: hypothetical protein M1835_006337 [Candelina submexicana]